MLNNFLVVCVVEQTNDDDDDRTTEMNFSEFVDEGHTTFQPFDVNITQRRPYYGPMQPSHLIVKYVCPALGIPGNILSMIIWLRRHVASKNSSAVYLAALAINDLVYITSNLSAYWLYMYDFIYHILTLALITAMLEPLLVLGFSVERLIAISFPLRVRLSITQLHTTYTYKMPRYRREDRAMRYTFRSLGSRQSIEVCGIARFLPG